MTNEQKQQIGALRKRGFGYLKIGQALCISGNTVRSFCRRNGFDTAAMANTAQCMQCGAPLKWKAGHREKKFCSAVCRAQWWNTHLDCVNRKAFYRLICKSCGKSFESYGNRHRKYCSHACYIADRYGKECEHND